MRQLTALHELATDLGSRVNRQLLTNAAAYPPLDRGNLGTLWWQAFGGIR